MRLLWMPSRSNSSPGFFQGFFFGNLREMDLNGFNQMFIHSLNGIEGRSSGPGRSYSPYDRGSSAFVSRRKGHDIFAVKDQFTPSDSARGLDHPHQSFAHGAFPTAAFTNQPQDFSFEDIK